MQIKHLNTNTNQLKFLLDFQVSLNDISSDDLFHTVLGIAERIDLNKYLKTSVTTRQYNRTGLFLCLILAMSEKGYASTRELERACRNDIRYMFLTENEKPSHMTFQNFIHDELKDSLEEIFYEINDIIAQDLKIAEDILYIDGSKFEANANKMTFVWKKSTKRYYTRAWKKFIELIRKINRFNKENNINTRYSVLKEPDIPYMITVGEHIENYMKENGIEFIYGKGHKKHEIQRLFEDLLDLFQKILKYTMYFDILGERNSFSKTDPDATFMHMKYDYYNHTGVFKPGYNVQFGTSDGFIRIIHVSSDANDVKTYIPLLEKYHEVYGKYPLVTPADAGYGSHDNYRYCSDHNIELCMKYSGIYKEQEKTNEKNQFQAVRMRQEDGSYRCPQGHIFEEKFRTISKKGLYDREMVHLECTHCNECPLKSKCTKAKGNRQITYCEETEGYKQQVRENVHSEAGKELMKRRSIYAEGAFGIIKEDFKYDRLRRRGESGVKLEIILVATGFNIRKYHSFKKEKEEILN